MRTAGGNVIQCFLVPLCFSKTIIYYTPGNPSDSWLEPLAHPLYLSVISHCPWRKRGDMTSAFFQTSVVLNKFCCFAIWFILCILSVSFSRFQQGYQLFQSPCRLALVWWADHWIKQEGRWWMMVACLNENKAVKTTTTTKKQDRTLSSKDTVLTTVKIQQK